MALRVNHRYVDDGFEILHVVLADYVVEKYQNQYGAWVFAGRQ